MRDPQDSQPAVMPHEPVGSSPRHFPPPPRPAPQIVPAPPGSRYDLMGRTPLHAWWRPVLGTVLVAVGFVAVGTAVIVGGGVIGMIAGAEMSGAGDQMFADPLIDLAINLLSIAAVLPVVYGVAVWIQRRPPGTLSSVLGRLRWRWMALCTGVAVCAAVLGQVATAATYAATGKDYGTLFDWAGWGLFLPALVVTLLLVPFQAAAEEYIFRGWLLQAFGAFFTSPWPGILLGAAGFTAMHGYTDWGILDVFTFGVLMGWLAVRTGGLEAAIGLHVINNALAFGFSGAAGDLDDALSQGSVPWQDMAGTVVQLGVFGIAVVILARRRGIATLSPRPAPSGPPVLS
ncbi:CPBP family intramembrane glutamic endopeptidase [Streptosporangium lutulentum]|uniref:Membrane protease YdiL (CAAX protease family) n=1 Tax=Streptosporangium lutulentum TaxID=1461250 RepID=A0ABT9Q546_9ACTN|nr:CPBP family intramembrane glutamic endopeptidase [Streptosporangium lutulentum]MDP9841807.1 membrane protease YdiL (CAAX protease family) [Streptosporangium lutulentum]